MGIQTIRQWTCDRCTFTEAVDWSVDQGLPSGWSTVEIKGGGRTPRTNPMDLCQSCTAEYLRFITATPTVPEEAD